LPLPLQDDGDGEPLGTVHDTTSMPSLRRTLSRDGSDNATDHSADDLGHEAAAEDPPTPSRHGSVRAVQAFQIFLSCMITSDCDTFIRSLPG
jgi:hypothetical protein